MILLFVILPTPQLGCRHVPLGPAIGLDDISLTFCPDWLWTVTLPISITQVARITNLSYCDGPCVNKFDEVQNTLKVQLTILCQTEQR
jgi:hypothetical protein